MRKKLKFIMIWLPFFLFLVASLLLELLPEKSMVVGTFITYIKADDKLYHFLGYTVLSILLFATLKKSTCISTGKAVLCTLLLGVCFGAWTEMMQTFVPSRGVEFMDFAANTMGVITGIISSRTISYIFRITI